MILEFAFVAALFVCCVTILIVGTITIIVWILNQVIKQIMILTKVATVILDYLVNKKNYKQWKQLKK